MTDTRGTPVLELRGITTVFPRSGVRANDCVDIAFHSGEIVGIIGENGAGKSTLMHVASGLIRPDHGRIMVRGETVSLASPADALSAGIGIVHQHPHIVADLPVWQNVILGREPFVLGNTGKSRAIERISALSASYGLLMDPLADTDGLDPPERFLTALLTALYGDPSVLILDEPATSFTGRNIDDLFDLITRLKEAGMAVAYISHKLRDILAISDRIIVMRRGRIVGRRDKGGTDAEELVKLMVGGDDTPPAPSPPNPVRDPSLRPVLELREARIKGAGPLSFDVYPGECLAVTGIRDGDFAEVEEVLSGNRELVSGEIRLFGSPLHVGRPAELRRHGVSYIPTDRLLRGASLESSVAENMILLAYRRFQKLGVMKTEEIEEFAGHLKGAFRIDGTADQEMGTLSGGNILKVILSRELSSDPPLVILSEPSWGLDVMSAGMVYARLRELTGRGSAVVVISTDMDEVLAIADRIVVIYRGSSAAVMENRNLDRRTLGSCILGVGGEAR